MARKTIQEYYDLIAGEVNNNTELLALEPNPDSAQTFLADIKSPSKVAEHRVWMWVFAFLAWVMDTMQVQHEAEVEAILKAGRYGTILYYINTAMAFQYGDTQEWVDDEYVYAAIDESKQIVKYAAATGSGKLVNIKVAKDNSGVPEKLTADEKNAFDAYFENHKPPGITFVSISMDPDLLKLELDIIYDPQILTGAGELITDNSIKPVETALQNYLNAVKFNSKFETVDLIDAIQQADGVVRPYLVSAQAKPDDGSAYSDISRSYLPVSGHMKIDPANPVTYNYIANV